MNRKVILTNIWQMESYKRLIAHTSRYDEFMCMSCLSVGRRANTYKQLKRCTPEVGIKMEISCLSSLGSGRWFYPQIMELVTL